MSDIVGISDGTFAVIGLIFGLIDMGANHCPNEGCLARNEVPGYTSVSIGETYFQEAHQGEELYFRRDTKLAFGPFQNIYGASISNDGEFWVGAGHAWTQPYFDRRAYIQLHAMTGLYAKGDGADLGGPIEFRSGIEVGYQARNGLRMGLGFDHRSNAGLYSDNPGLETIHFRVSIPTR